jgi:hypothetical protein
MGRLEGGKSVGDGKRVLGFCGGIGSRNTHSYVRQALRHSLIDFPKRDLNTYLRRWVLA